MRITFWYYDNPENTFAVTLHQLSYSSSTGFRNWRFDLYPFSDQIAECSELLSGFYDISTFFSKTMSSQLGVYVVVQFYPRFKFYLFLFLDMVIYDNEFETKEKYNLNQG